MYKFYSSSTLRQVHSFLQSEFSQQFDLVLPLSSYTAFSFSSCLRLFPLLLLPAILPSIKCFRSQLLCKMWSIQLAFLLFTVCRMFLSSLTLCDTSSFFTRSVQVIFSILLQHQISELSRISDLISEAFSIQRHEKQCSKCNISLLSSLNLSPIYCLLVE